MIQDCIDEPVNSTQNLKALRHRLPPLQGPDERSKKLLGQISLYRQFLQDNPEDPELSELPPDLKQEVLRGRRSLKGARKAKKCGHCHQWRSSKTQLLTHPCPYKLVLPYCPRPAADANFGFVTSARNEEDEYAGRLVEIFTDIHDHSGKWEPARIEDAFEDGTMTLSWLVPGTLNPRRGRNKTFRGKLQEATGGAGAILWKWRA